MDTNEANYQTLEQSSPSGSTPTPIVGLRSEFHHTSVGNWVGGKKQRCASGARSAEQVSERRHSESARATSATLINYMHVHYNLISGREKEEPIVQIPKYEHSDYSIFNACVCMSTLVLFATPCHEEPSSTTRGHCAFRRHSVPGFVQSLWVRSRIFHLLI